jgi:hypothetical protein
MLYPIKDPFDREFFTDDQNAAELKNLYLLDEKSSKKI